MYEMYEALGIDTKEIYEGIDIDTKECVVGILSSFYDRTWINTSDGGKHEVDYNTLKRIEQP